jgi:hypothetical protein
VAECEYGRRKVSIGTDGARFVSGRKSGDLAVLGNVSMDGGNVSMAAGMGLSCGRERRVVGDGRESVLWRVLRPR